MRDLFFSKFTVHSAYSSSCRPMYDGVSPHWKERERKIVCVWCWQCGVARRTRRSVALAYHAHHHTRHYGTLAYRSSTLPPRAVQRVPRRAPRRMHAAAPVRTTPNMWQPWLDAGRKLIRSGVSLLAPPFVRNVQCCNIWSRQIHTAPLLLPADTDWTVVSVR